MNNNIYPCLWFDNQAGEAANFYCTVFPNSQITVENSLVVMFELDGKKFMGLNGGPQFKPNAAVSFYVTYEDANELEQAWQKLADGGFVFMALDRYDWSEKYGWIQDKYGVSWQLTLGSVRDVGQRFVPLLMFCGEQQGNAEAAMAFYTSLFKNSSIDFVARYEPGQAQTDASIVHARFKLDGDMFMAMDSGVTQPFSFTEGNSIVITCDTQDEIDYFWESITREGKESMCGWCQDQFGLWWQVVPAMLGPLMSDPEKSGKVMAAFMKMKKFDIQGLLDAAE